MNTIKILICATIFILTIVFFCLPTLAQDEFEQSQSAIGKFTRQKDYSVAQSNFPKFPSKKNPLRIGEFQSMYAKINNAKTLVPKVYAIYNDEDWKTQGDWYGRITPEYAILCAMDAPFDHEIRHSCYEYQVISFMGPNHDYEEAIDEDDELRYWLHWRRTEDRRALWTPLYAFRRQAEWNDHGEAYPWTKDGPDVWYLLDLNHAGVFDVSMYFYNKDGHSGANRMRDYLIEIYPSPKAWDYELNDRTVYSELAEKQVSKMPPLAKARVNMFWGGVHKKFTLAGPCSYFVKIDRNYSFNTIISAVMIRQVHGEPTWAMKDKKIGMPDMGRLSFDPPPLPEKNICNGSENIIKFWKLIDSKMNSPDVILRQYRYKMALYVTAEYITTLNIATEEDKQLAKALKWRLNQWDEEQRKEFIDVMLKGWRAYYLKNSYLRNIIRDNRSRFPHIYKEPRYDENSYPELIEQKKNIKPNNPNKKI
ncbi:MAG: hypothetical protein LBC02_11300 [Planctomycetaceae bacterium]|jgi:hypothetical protein|nr:hypothetical protein [Planctomycetaceae bacterium]